jgi:hypothetical protein
MSIVWIFWSVSSTLPSYTNTLRDSRCCASKLAKLSCRLSWGMNLTTQVESKYEACRVSSSFHSYLLHPGWKCASNHLRMWGADLHRFTIDLDTQLNSVSEFTCFKIFKFPYTHINFTCGIIFPKVGTQPRHPTAQALYDDPRHPSRTLHRSYAPVHNGCRWW